MPTGAVVMGKDMNHGHAAPDSTKYDIAAYIMAGLALIGILLLHLLSALLAGGNFLHQRLEPGGMAGN